MTLKRTTFSLLLRMAGILLVTGIAAAQDQDTSPVDEGGQLPVAQDTGTQQLVPTQQAEATTASSISALGSVEANRVATLQFQSAGTVQGVYVQIGDYAQAGEVLADPTLIMPG